MLLTSKTEMDFQFFFFFLRQLGLFWGFDSGGTQSKAKLSIQNKMNPDVPCQLRGIKKRKKKKKNRIGESVF